MPCLSSACVCLLLLLAVPGTQGACMTDAQIQAFAERVSSTRSAACTQAPKNLLHPIDGCNSTVAETCYISYGGHYDVVTSGPDGGNRRNTHPVPKEEDPTTFCVAKQCVNRGDIQKVNAAVGASVEAWHCNIAQQAAENTLANFPGWRLDVEIEFKTQMRCETLTSAYATPALASNTVNSGNSNFLSKASHNEMSSLGLTMSVSMTLFVVAWM